MSEKQYFNGLLPMRENAVYVDGGAYDGDTVKEFIEYVSGNFKHIYAFEMDEETYPKCLLRKFDDRVEFINAGLWDEKKEVHFASQGQQSTILEVGKKTAKVVALDDVIPKEEKVTFIKMDIEGAEIKALLGARRCITENKPDLAICVYHRQGDIYEIPALLIDMVLDYRFYIRHHSAGTAETVLYAVR